MAAEDRIGLVHQHQPPEMPGRQIHGESIGTGSGAGAALNAGFDFVLDRLQCIRRGGRVGILPVLGVMGTPFK
jgi:hypothetical protein